jgi:hypothetical protein
VVNLQKLLDTSIHFSYLFSELIPPQGRYLFGFGGSVVYEHGVAG